MAKVRDKVRVRFERSKFDGMTADDALALVKEHGMFVTNLYEDRGGMWRIFTRHTLNGRLAASGFGEDVPEAVWHLFYMIARQGLPNEDLPPRRSFETPAGEMDQEAIDRYCAPSTSQWPADLGKSDEELGLMDGGETDLSDDAFPDLDDDENDLIGDIRHREDIADLL